MKSSHFCPFAIRHSAGFGKWLKTQFIQPFPFIHCLSAGDMSMSRPADEPACDYDLVGMPSGPWSSWEGNRLRLMAPAAPRGHVSDTNKNAKPTISTSNTTCGYDRGHAGLAPYPNAVISRPDYCIGCPRRQQPVSDALEACGRTNRTP